MNRWGRVSAVVAVIICCAFADSAVYAATDVNELGRLLGGIKKYDFGDSRTDLIKISDMIRESASRPEMKKIEKQLDDFLESDAAYAAKQFVCRQLSMVGTEASVPVLGAMLTDEKYSDMARYALERIPGEAVDNALREALPKAKGKAKIGIINTLGVRADVKATPLLAGLIADANEMVAGAAAAALGNIADPCATEVLAKAKVTATGMLRTRVLDAYLNCADRLVSKGKTDSASAIYRQLYDSKELLPVRTAAARGVIITAGDKTADTIVEVIKSGAPEMQTVAIGLLKDVANKDVVKAAAAQLPNLPAVQQVQMLAALADCKDSSVLPEVLSAVKSNDESVRIAAIVALGDLGNASTVDLLVSTAASTAGEEQKAARDSLYLLKGIDVDQVIMQKLPQTQTKEKIELILSCDQRNMTAAVPILLKIAGEDDSRAKIEAIKALRDLAKPEDLDGLIALLMSASRSARAELEKTVVVVARQIPADKGPGAKILAVLPEAKDLDVKSSLMSVLGRIGDPAALPVLREALLDKQDKMKDAAVRALSDWPTAQPAADLLNVAKNSDNQVHRVLALRGYVRLAGLESDRPAGETIEMYKEAMALAPSVTEKQMVLSGLGDVKSYEALQMAAGYLDDSELKQEAEAAVAKIAEATIETHPRETKELLRRVVDSTKSETVRERAQGLLERNR